MNNPWRKCSTLFLLYFIQEARILGGETDLSLLLKIYGGSEGSKIEGHVSRVTIDFTFQTWLFVKVKWTRMININQTCARQGGECTKPQGVKLQNWGQLCFTNKRSALLFPGETRRGVGTTCIRT